MMRLCLPLVMLLAGCSAVYEDNAEYINEVSSRFESGQSWDDIKALLSQLGEGEALLYNPCTGDHGDESTPCERYQLVANIPLPHEHPSAGGATGQLYFTFGPNKVLDEFSYEIHYENRR